MNVSLSDPLKQFVGGEVREGGFASTSEYMRDLIRQRRRVKTQETLRQQIAEGQASAPTEAVTSELSEQIRNDLRERLARGFGREATTSACRGR
jgi:antitoxin ParD1/3/4